MASKVGLLRRLNEHPLPAFSAAVVLTVVAYLAASISVVAAYDTFERSLSRGRAVQEEASTIRYLDEVLTMSARMAAATADTRWEQRYLSHESELESAITRARELAPELYAGSGAAQTEAANVLLVKLEKQAFELVRQARGAEALSLLNSAEYERQKALYAAGLDGISRSARQRFEESFQALRKGLLFGAASCLVAVPVLIFAWLSAIRTLRRYLAERRRVEARLRESEAQVVSALRRSDELKMGLLNSVSHESKTPLAAIKGAVTCLIDQHETMPGGQRRVFLDDIHQEVDFMDRLIDNILEAAKLESGPPGLERGWYPLEELVEGATRRLGWLPGQPPLSIEIPESLPPLYVDGQMMHQVLRNLFDNAAKYSPRDTPIALSADCRGDEVVVTVRSVGEGVDPGELERIFDRFYRVPGSEFVTRGSGLGLAICRRAIEAHGGRIHAESAPGQGLSVIFSLPAPQPPSISGLD